MNNHQAVVDQIVQNLAFEVEAVPKNKLTEATRISQSTPLNVKIKVRKKNEILMQHDVSSIADDTPRAAQKIRLVNSDRTIMTFDVFMEAEFDKRPSRKLRKHIFDMLRPGICLGAVDDDEYPYMPSSSYSANITEPSVANKSDGTLKQTFTLSKNVYQAYTVSTQPKEQKWMYGKCKPGGCLDPPFSEDKYSYKPSIRSGPERKGEEQLEEEDVGSEIFSKKIPITLHDEEIESNGRHSSIFDSGIFKKKRKSSDKSTNTKFPDTTDSIVDIYQGESAKNSISTNSNSIITYPPKVSSDPRISDDKTVRSRRPSEDKSRKSFNDHSEPYFIRPKGANRIKERETLDSNDYPKHRSSDATDLKNSLKESFKMPVPLPIPIPIPVPISIMSNNQKPVIIAKNDNILKTEGGSANVTELDAISDRKPHDQEPQDPVNLKGTDIPLRLLRDTSATGDTDDKLVESSEIVTSTPSNVKQPTTPNETDNQNMQKIKLKLLKEINSENNIEPIAQPSKKTKTEPLNKPGPVPVPSIFSQANRAAALDPKIIDDNLQRSEMKTQSKQSFETKTTPQTIKDTTFEDSKDMHKNIDPENRSEKSASTATATPKSQYNDIGADAIPENYLRTRGGFSDQENDTENPVTIAPTTEEDIKREEILEIIEKPAKQNYIKDKVATFTVVAAVGAATAAAAAAAATIEVSSEIYEMQDTNTQKILGSQDMALSKLPILKISKSLLSGSKTSAASVEDTAKRSDSPDKHLDNFGHRDTDKSLSILSGSKTLAASVKDKSKRSESPDKHLETIGHRDTEKIIPILSRGKTSAASVKDKTKRSDSPDKHLDDIGQKDTDKSISILSGSKTSAASVKDKTRRTDSPDKHLDNARPRDTDKSVSILSGSKTSAASVKDKSKRSDSPDKYLENIGHREIDKIIPILSRGKTSAASFKDKTKRNDSPDKHLDNTGHRDSEKSISTLCADNKSAAPVTDKTKKSDIPGKHWDNIGYRDTDIGVYKDEKRTSLSSGATSAASVKDKTKKSDSPDKYLDKDGHRETDKSISILSGSKRSAVSVTDKTKRSDSPEKHLDKIGHRDTDKGIPILSRGETSAASVSDKTTRSDSPEKHLDKIGHRDTDKGIPILSRGKTSAASVSDKTTRNYSPDKFLDNAGHADSEKSITILSRGKTSVASGKDKSKRSDSPDKYLDNDGHRETDKSIFLLSGSKTSAVSVIDKTKRSDSPEKHLVKIGHRDTDKGIPILSRGKTSAASVSDKTTRNDSPDILLDNAGHRDSEKSITILSRGRTSVASVKDKSKRSDSPGKQLDNTGHRDTDKSIPILSRSKTSAASVTDKTKRSDSPDKYWDSVGHKDTDESVSILNRGKTSAESVTDKTNRSGSPDKYWDTIEHRDTDLGNHKDKKRTSLSSRETSAASVKDKKKRTDSPGKHFDSVGHIDTDITISMLSGSKTSASSVKNKSKRSDRPDKHLDNIGHIDTDKSISVPIRGKTLAASVTDRTKRSDSPGKYWDSVGHEDIDLGVHKDEKRTSLSNGPKYETDTRYSKISEPPSIKEFVNEIEKSNNNDTFDSYTESEARFTGVGSMNFKAAPVIIDNTKPTSNFEPLKEVYSETNLFGEPMETGREFDPSGVPFTTQIASRLRKFDEDDGTHSTVSRELIGTKSVIYDTDGYIPTMPAIKIAERIPTSDTRVIPPVDTVVPSVQSTSTLKSAMKKDTMSVELGFRSFLNDRNERMLQTFDAANAPKRSPNDSITVLKSQIRISSNEIRIPVDSEHDMFIQIKKSNANQRVSISESRFANVIDKGRVLQQRSPVLCSDAEMRSSAAKAEVRKEKILENEATDDHFIDYYEQELVPLQLIIKNLRDEIDVLAAQQLIFKDKLFCANKSKIPRVVHSNKKCFGCVRK